MDLFISMMEPYHFIFLHGIRIFDSETEADSFLNYLNLQHPRIKFTSEKGFDKKLPFLDILNLNEDTIVTSIFRKRTFTGLLLNYNSFTPLPYKRGLLQTLLDRAYQINNTWLGFHYNLSDLKIILQRNE